MWSMPDDRKNGDAHTIIISNRIRSMDFEREPSAIGRDGEDVVFGSDGMLRSNIPKAHEIFRLQRANRIGRCVFLRQESRTRRFCCRSGGKDRSVNDTGHRCWPHFGEAHSTRPSRA